MAIVDILSLETAFIIGTQLFMPIYLKVGGKFQNVELALIGGLDLFTGAPYTGLTLLMARCIPLIIPSSHG